MSQKEAFASEICGGGFFFIPEKVCETKTFEVYGISYFEDDGSYNRIKV